MKPLRRRDAVIKRVCRDCGMRWSSRDLRAEEALVTVAGERNRTVKSLAETVSTNSLQKLRICPESMAFDGSDGVSTTAK